MCPSKKGGPFFCGSKHSYDDFCVGAAAGSATSAYVCPFYFLGGRMTEPPGSAIVHEKLADLSLKLTVLSDQK